MAMSKKYNTGVAKLEPVANPMDLYNSWKAEAKKFIGPNIANSFALATVSKNNFVTNRFVYCLEEFQNRFVFNTSKQSPKYDDMKQHSQVSGIFLWDYKNDKTSILKQIRMVGDIIELERSVTEGLFKKAPLFAQVRSVLYQHSHEVDWDKLHNEVEDKIKQVRESGMQMKCPEHEVTMEMVPKDMEFYYAYDDFFADRILYKKESQNKWSYKRLAA